MPKHCRCYDRYTGHREIRLWDKQYDIKKVTYIYYFFLRIYPCAIVVEIIWRGTYVQLMYVIYTILSVVDYPCHHICHISDLQNDIWVMAMD